MFPPKWTIVLLNRLCNKDNKALGVGYHVGEDKLFLMVAVNFSTRKKKLRTKEVVSKLQGKTFSAIITTAQAKKLSASGGPSSVDAMIRDGAFTSPSTVNNGRSLPGAATASSSAAFSAYSMKRFWGLALVGQVNLLRFATLTKLCGAVRYIRRAVDSWLFSRNQTRERKQWEAVLTVQEREEAFKDLYVSLPRQG